MIIEVVFIFAVQNSNLLFFTNVLLIGVSFTDLFGASNNQVVNIDVGDTSDNDRVALTMVIFIDGIDSRDESLLGDPHVVSAPLSAISVLPFFESLEEVVSILDGDFLKDLSVIGPVTLGGSQVLRFHRVSDNWLFLTVKCRLTATVLHLIVLKYKLKLKIK